MKFQKKLIKAKFLKRYKRFFSEHVLEDNTTVIAHCPNPGAMTGIAIAGVTSWLSIQENPKRKLKWTWELVNINNNLIGINTHNPNNIVAEAIKDNKIKEVLGYKTLSREAKYGQNSKIDILLEYENKEDCYLEVKNVHLSRYKEIAEFPDSVTERGKKHLIELSNVVLSGKRAILLFLIQRNDTKLFKIAKDIDPKYFVEFEKALSVGLEVICLSCNITPEEINIGPRVKLSVE